MRYVTPVGQLSPPVLRAQRVHVRVPAWGTFGRGRPRPQIQRGSSASTSTGEGWTAASVADPGQGDNAASAPAEDEPVQQVYASETEKPLWWRWKALERPSQTTLDPANQKMSLMGPQGP